MRNELASWQVALVYLGVAIATTAIAMTVMGLWDANLRVPFEPGGDGLLHAVIVRIIEETGWVSGSSNLGFPGTLDLYDFPAYDTLGVLLIRLIAIFVDDHFLLLNLTFLISFPLISVATLWSSRRMGLGWWTSIGVAILFTMAPYHFRRGVGHLFLSFYEVVPLITMVAFRLAVAANEEVWGGLSRRSVILIALLTGLSGVYYPFFGCFLLAVAAALRWIRSGSVRSTLPAVITIGLVVGVFLMAMSPAIISRMSSDSPDVVKRQAPEAERYGLKIAQLILPITDHRVGELRETKADYNRGPLVNENDLSSLGAIGAFGFVTLLWWLIRATLRESDRTGVTMALMNLALVLLGTVGGFGALFALEVSADIRSYNRVSIFILFLSLVAVAITIEKLAVLRRSKWRIPALVIVLVTLGTLDQTNSSFANFHDLPVATEMKVYGDAIEARLPAGSQVLQLPVFPFPEEGRVYELGDYDHFRPYLFTEGYDWSYGAMRGTYPLLWQKNLEQQTPEDMVDGAVLAGFDAIYIDRTGFPDRQSPLIPYLESIDGVEGIWSKDRRYVTFPLDLYAERLEASIQAERRERLEREVVSPLIVAWGRRCSGEERDDAGNRWRWCDDRASFKVFNGLDETVRARISFGLAVAGHDPATVTVTSDLGSPILEITPEGERFSFELEIPAGRHLVELESSQEAVEVEGDSRDVGLRFDNFELVALDPE